MVGRPIPTFAGDGTVSVPAFRLPPSSLRSEAARTAQGMRAAMPLGSGAASGDDSPIAERRAQVDAWMAPRAAQLRERFPADVEEARIGGVPVRVFTPRDVPVDGERVLINLHGGAFHVGWDSGSVVESLPMASLAGVRVISVDYRMAPEFRHPAGVEDVAAVYAALLRSHAPQRIGIYGGSAGGNLAGQAAARLAMHDMPQAGAIGIFGAGAVPFGTGDSAYLAGFVDGLFVPPRDDGTVRDIMRGYFAGWDVTDPSISPALHPGVIARFPPTLIVNGTRAMDLSPAIVTNSALLRAGVRSTLIVGEAMGHCYYYDIDLPEARDAYAAMVAFFAEHLA